ncbi:glucosamine-6-phosphate deaminase [Cerasicoccus maritimus]|uniref:glucosamine-6-phosphate deaminase n=1 Tax=Cerasicoccus maritimus TaxID=490089 RepID=UPI002852A98B|nr:glucosamine-6-phosphate deaminase [Cerasicoccus maritimus]
MKNLNHLQTALQVDSLVVEVFPNRQSQGSAAAAHVIHVINQAIEIRGEARVIFACAPSQDDFLSALIQNRGKVDWSKVVVFHMDDYVGLSGDSPQSFRFYLQENLLSYIECKEFFPIGSEAEDPDAECARYEAALKSKPIDLVCMGIGENGHIAFNDPSVADFNDSAWVKVVELEPACRQQQVNDGCFLGIDDVPTHAFTLTIPSLMSCRHVSCVVPGKLKADAVGESLRGPISKDCPASILRTHPAAVLWLDGDAALRI